MVQVHVSLKMLKFDARFKAISYEFQDSEASMTFDGLYLFCDVLFLLTTFFIIFFYSIFCIIAYNKKIFVKSNNFQFFIDCWFLLSLLLLAFELCIFFLLDDVPTHSTKIEIIAETNLDADPLLKKHNKFPVSETIKQLDLARQRHDLLINQMNKFKQDELAAKECYSIEFFNFCSKFNLEKNISSVGLFNFVSYDQKLFWVESNFFKNGDTYKISELSYNPTEFENKKTLLLQQNKNCSVIYDTSLKDRMRNLNLIRYTDQTEFFIERKPGIIDLSHIHKKSDYYKYPYLYNKHKTSFPYHFEIYEENQYNQK